MSIEELQKTVDPLAQALPNVTSKKMFGSPAYWVNGNVFALVWKHGRIGVKLPNESKYEALMSAKGAAPWKAGPMTMAHWVLVPEAFHGDKTQLKKWLKEAHTLNEVAIPKKKAAIKKKKAKKA
jgi:TfoX/Sxy family transcriptional regulator of competence genes